MPKSYPDLTYLTLECIDINNVEKYSGSRIGIKFPSLRVLVLDKCYSRESSFNLIEFFSIHSLFTNIHTLKLINTHLLDLNLNYFSTINYLFIEGNIGIDKIEIPSTSNISLVSLINCKKMTIEANKYLDELVVIDCEELTIICKKN